MKRNTTKLFVFDMIPNKGKRTELYVNAESYEKAVEAAQSEYKDSKITFLSIEDVKRDPFYAFKMLHVK